MPKILEGMGSEGKPIVLALKRLQERFPTSDKKKIGKAGAGLEALIQTRNPESLVEPEKPHVAVRVIVLE